MVAMNETSLKRELLFSLQDGFPCSMSVFDDEAVLGLKCEQI